MLLKQLSIFLENKPGALAEITKILNDNKVNIRALSMADTENFGILRIIVQDVQTVYELLKQNKFTVKITEVIGVKVNDRPGGLYNIVSKFYENNINVEYMYAFVNRTPEDAMLIFKVHNKEQAINILVKNNFEIIRGEDISKI